MTAALDRQVYISKVNEMLQDANTYEIVMSKKGSDEENDSELTHFIS